MPSSQKSTKTSPGDASQAARVKPKTGQQQAAKSGGSVAKPDSQEEKAATEDQEAPKGTERKTSAKLSTTKERASTGQTLATRPRKLTPQQQVHLARARRRRLRERMWLGFGALLVVGVIAVVAWQVIAKNAESTRQANQHAAATATAAVHATATQTALNILEPETPPAVTGKTITTKDGLQYIDIKVGKGTAIKQGDTFNARYVGWNVPANCQVVDVCQFDSSYYENIQQNKDPMTPTQFQLVGPDQNGVIQGWVEGVAGMKPGGKRRLIIPAALAYGSQAQSSAPEQAIPANATLIFDIELVSISNTSTPTPAPTPSG